MCGIESVLLQGVREGLFADGGLFLPQRLTVRFGSFDGWVGEVQRCLRRVLLLVFSSTVTCNFHCTCLVSDSSLNVRKQKRTGLQLCRGRKGWWCFSRYLQAVYPLFYFSVFLSLLFSFLYLFPSVYLFIYLFIYWSGKIAGSVVWSLWTWREERFVSAALQLRTKLSVLRNPWSFLPLFFLVQC